MPRPHQRGQRGIAVDGAESVSSWRGPGTPSRARRAAPGCCRCSRTRSPTARLLGIGNAETSTTRRSLPKMSMFLETVSSFWNEASIVDSTALHLLGTKPTGRQRGQVGVLDDDVGGDLGHVVVVLLCGAGHAHDYRRRDRGRARGGHGGGRACGRDLGRAGGGGGRGSAPGSGRTSHRSWSAWMSTATFMASSSALPVLGPSWFAPQPGNQRPLPRAKRGHWRH